MNERIKTKLLKRVESFISIITEDCIVYPYLNSDKYGDIQYIDENDDHKHILAHRLVYTLKTNEVLTSSDIILHLCDNPSCINIKHLQKGTHKDNMIDKVNKERQAKGTQNGRYKHGHYSKYDFVAKPKPLFTSLYSRSLTIEEVKEIKNQIRSNIKSLKQISIDTSIKYQTIRDISCGRIYKDVI